MPRLCCGTVSIIPKAAGKSKCYFRLLFCREAGIPHITMDVIAGLPGETEADFARTMEAARQLRQAEELRYQKAQSSAAECIQVTSKKLAETLAYLQTLQDSDLIGAIEEKIGRLGPVNMCAIDELAELEAREEFLKVEQEDIQKAADHLMQMIDRLTGECDRRFEDTFNTVRANFQDMFTYLFGGGQAELVLAAPEAGEDQLDRGIDIIARPPGKSPKSISLLSGGEKALCAVALLFAIFRSKPSPQVKPAQTLVWRSPVGPLDLLTSS